MKGNSKWIWPVKNATPDSYAEFYETFEFSGDNAQISICADSNYAIYLNGSLVDSGQYPDFPHYKIYDKIDITDYCVKGENRLCIIVWYYGVSNMSYYPGNAALKFEVSCDGNLCCISDENTPSRISNTYKNGLRKLITHQLGFSYWYDFTKQDDWFNGRLQGFNNSVIINQQLQLYPRPISKFLIGDKVCGELVKQNNDCHYLYDLGRESVGYLTFKIKSPCNQHIKVAYGEHIIDGGVRFLISGRDFSADFTLKAGDNVYANPFRRFGLRYIEVFTEQPIEIEFIGICPTDYPLNLTGKAPEDALRKQIYDVSVRTLQLCMHDHYEDTPWREQALYAMDSRNQMLCGYYAFGEYAFPRACLYLMSKDNREDNLLSICFPNDSPLTIPSFSLHYFTEVYEYTVYSKDMTLIKEIYPKLLSIINAFIHRLEGGLLPTWTEDNYWNFYEWTKGLEGSLGKESKRTFDAPLNCLFVIALENMQKICDLLGIEANYLTIAQNVRENIQNRFFNKSTGTYKISDDDSSESELVNALAILCDVSVGEQAENIANKLTDSSSELTPCSLSMLCFKYDALLKLDREKYKNYILDDINVKYSRMLDAGATSFWETELGDADFDNAGSLCHAWSSMPVYYFHTLLD